MKLRYEKGLNNSGFTEMFYILNLVIEILNINQRSKKEEKKENYMV